MGHPIFCGWFRKTTVKARISYCLSALEDGFEVLEGAGVFGLA